MKHALPVSVCDVLSLIFLIGGLVWGCEVLMSGGTLSEAGVSVFIGACLSALFQFD